jgi:glycosyltransferase involved in cell wall biosynthesis
MVLFFEYLLAIRREHHQGILSRNVAQYERFLEEGDFDRFYWFTSHRSDQELLDQLRQENPFWNSVELLMPPKLLDNKPGALLYSFIGPFIHWRTLSKVDVVKAHQVSGSWTSMIAAWITRKPYLFRLGYPLSGRFKTENKPFRAWITRQLEKLQMRTANHAAVTSNEMLEYYGAMAPKTPITLLPNYVDLKGFRPVESYDMTRPILFVGRLHEVKNIINLMTACARLGHPLHLYGGGPQESELRAYAEKIGADVTFKGFVPNTELMRIHHDYSLYILCSTREGMPKTLIEAMASGLICVGTPVGGILELIEDNVTGYLTEGFEADDIETKLRWVLENYDPAVGRQAAQFARDTLSLDYAVELERDVLQSIMKRKDDRRTYPTPQPAE